MSDDKFVTDYRLQSLLSGNGWIPGKEINSGGGGATTYTQLTDAATVALPTINTPLSTALTTLSTSISGKQNTLTAGNNIILNGNTISATSGASSYVQLTDYESVDLPSLNTPLSNALADINNNKQGTLVAGNNIQDFSANGIVQTAVNPTFGTVNATEISFPNSINKALNYFNTITVNLGFPQTGTSETYPVTFTRVGDLVVMSLQAAIIFTAVTTNTIATSIPSAMIPITEEQYFFCMEDNGSNFGSLPCKIDLTGTLSIGLEDFTVGTEYKIMPFSFAYNCN